MDTVRPRARRSLRATTSTTSRLGRSTVPIGRPISNTQLYVLDQRRQLVPTGVAGELFIGGDGLARGYLNDPALTSERFVRHPFSSDPDARLYRTGDRVRQRADGVIEYLGRLDHQLKVRGFRVEPGEIEAALRACDGIRDALVMLREDRPGDRRLVAYVVTGNGGPARGLELRRALQERLPDYMVPSAVVCLPALPLNANGKVDRRRLPSPDLSGGLGPGVAPSTELERAIADIWRDDAADRTRRRTRQLLRAWRPLPADGTSPQPAEDDAVA